MAAVETIYSAYNRIQDGVVVIPLYPQDNVRYIIRTTWCGEIINVPLTGTMLVFGDSVSWSDADEAFEDRVYIPGNGWVRIEFGPDPSGGFLFEFGHGFFRREVVSPPIWRTEVLQ